MDRSRDDGHTQGSPRAMVPWGRTSATGRPVTSPTRSSASDWVVRKMRASSCTRCPVERTAWRKAERGTTSMAPSASHRASMSDPE